MTINDRFKGCILLGAIGDAMGSCYENQVETPDDTFYLFSKPKFEKPTWQITDDTQLTLATIEAMVEDKTLNPETFAQHFLKLYRQRKITGIGASTLKALQELQFGGHWSQVGRKGEFAAGNGAAMRIAPLAFYPNISRRQIQEICSITHQNDEAYVGALVIVLSIQSIINNQWNSQNNLFEILIPQLPDTRVRDRLIEIQHITDLEEIGSFGNSGYIVDSVPLAIAAANQIGNLGIDKMFSMLIKIGGDTDTNCSIAGQIAGALIGKKEIPHHLLQKLESLNEFVWIEETIQNYEFILI
ncbi:MAG: ADP-ribosylglycohydrolase family protein [Saprospiraceae bacterium]